MALYDDLIFGLLPTSCVSSTLQTQSLARDPVDLTCGANASGFSAGSTWLGDKASAPANELPAAIREKLKMLSFVSILVVLVNHSATYSLVYDGVVMKQPSAVAEFFLHLWQGSFGRVNRLLFFSISGFLFFWTLKPEVAGFMDKWKKRLKSLLIPYLIWSFIGCVVFLLLCKIDATRQLIGRRIEIASYDWIQLLRLVLWNPIPYQLWYIRDLGALFILSPVIYVAARVMGWWLGIALILCWIFGFLPGWPEESGVAFFTVGAVIATERIVPSWNLRPWLIPSAAVWVLACVVNTALYTQGVPVSAIIKIGSLSGLVTVWGLIDYVSGTLRAAMSSAAAFTFFIYAAHEPLLGLVRKFIFKTIPFTGATSILAFLILPLITLAICISAGALLRASFPSVFGVLTGGRGQGKG